MDRIEDRIDNYLLEMDEGRRFNLAKDISKLTATGSYKGIAWLIEHGFDLLTRKVSDTLEKSSADTSMMKIDKIENSKKKIKLLERKAEQYKENYVRIVLRIETELENINK